MNDIKSIESKLKCILKEINEDCLNYVADIEFFKAGNVGKLSADKIIESALGSPAIIGNTFVASENEVIEELRLGLEYGGTDGAYPNKRYVGSAKHKEDVGEILDEIKGLLTGATQLTGFWLKEGHPFYPVFWDFAFIVEFEEEAYVFVGSSSD